MTEKRVPVLGGYYEVTDDGRLYSIRSAKFLRPSIDKSGYRYYVISINGHRETHKAHRLVAQAFLPNPYNKPSVNHKNGVRTDNRVQNLEWATMKEQANDPLTRAHVEAVNAKTDYRAMGAKRDYGRRRTKVVEASGAVKIYNSLKEAAEAQGANYHKASECANGKRKTAGGVVFRYV